MKEVKKKEKKNVNEEIKKEVKKKNWLDKLTLEQIVFGGIIIVVILLIVLIFVSTKNTKTKNGDDIVIKLNGKTITANELYTSLKEKNGKTVAINMVDEYILNKEYETTDDMKQYAEQTIESAKSQYKEQFSDYLSYIGLSSENEFKDLVIKNQKIAEAAKAYVKDSLTKKEMKEYYENSIKGDIKASHILISSETDENATDEQKETKKNEAKKKAEEIIEKLKNGEKFDELAKQYSEDTGSKANGGDLGYFNTGEMVKEFEEAAYKLKLNEYTTSPVETTYGYHIILKTGEKEKVSYEKAKDTIIKNITKEKQEQDTDLNNKAILALRKKYKMVIKDKKIKKEYQNELNSSSTNK